MRNSSVRSSTFLLHVLVALVAAVSTNTRSPVILIPGIGGNQFEVKLNRLRAVREYCPKTTTGFMNVWMNVSQLLPPNDVCWVEYMSLGYNRWTRTTRDAVGVISRVPGWGSPDVLEWLYPASEAPYFAAVAEELVAQGYVRNKTLRGAPYDFRKGPNENVKFFIDLKILVEQTYAMNANQPVTFIVHSMGGPMALMFLQSQTDVWKDKYIARLISLAASWAGSFKPLMEYTIGDNLGISGVNGRTIRKEIITNPSTAWMMPSSQLWRPDEVLVQTPRKNYTLGTIRDFFYDLSYPNGWEMYSDLRRFNNLRAPGVEVHCLFGTNVNTLERMEFASSNLISTPRSIHGDGDGTVNIRSLRVCGRWNGAKEQLGKPVSLVELPRVTHTTILGDEDVLSYIVQVLTK